MALTTYIKGRSKDVTTGEETVTYFTDEEWAAQEQARLDSEAAEAARDLDEEELDKVTRVFKAFLKVYAQREGVTIPQLRAAIKAEM